jgi:exopolysaccharide production protein ExoZ
LAGQDSKLYSIQALRGIAAFLVVVAHSIEHGPGHASNSIILTGRFGVEIFFVISGLVVLIAAGPTSFSPRKFLIRRLWRVAPLYWLTTFMVAGIAIIMPRMLLSTSFEPTYLLRSLVFIPTPVPGSLDWRPLFKLGWTLNYEVFFYIVVALTFACRTMAMRGGVILVVMAAFILSAFFVTPKSSILAFYANLNLLPFAGGVLLAIFLPSRFSALPRSAKWFVGILAVLATIAFYQVPFDMTKALHGHLIMAGAAILL